MSCWPVVEPGAVGAALGICLLMAGLLGREVLTKDYETVRIRIAFHPQTEKFEVANPAIRAFWRPPGFGRRYLPYWRLPQKWMSTKSASETPRRLRITASECCWKARLVTPRRSSGSNWVLPKPILNAGNKTHGWRGQSSRKSDQDDSPDSGDDRVVDGARLSTVR